MALAKPAKSKAIVDAWQAPETNNPIKRQACAQSTPDIRVRISGVEMSIAPGSVTHTHTIEHMDILFIVLFAKCDRWSCAKFCREK